VLCPGSPRRSRRSYSGAPIRVKPSPGRGWSPVAHASREIVRQHATQSLRKLFSSYLRRRRLGEDRRHLTPRNWCGRSLEKFPEIVPLLKSILERFVNALSCLGQCFVPTKLWSNSRHRCKWEGPRWAASTLTRCGCVWSPKQSWRFRRRLRLHCFPELGRRGYLIVRVHRFS
jgi:hypothetical protein